MFSAASSKMQEVRKNHISQMPLTRTKKISLAIFAAIILAAALFVARNLSSGSATIARGQLLQLAPLESSAVIFFDLDQIRETPFLTKLYSWAPHPAEDSEYAQFVRDTGFSYERDLHRAVIAISNRGANTSMVAIADGNFDRKKMEAFLNRNGKSSQQNKWKVFTLNATANDKPISLAFLSDHRVAIADSDNLSGVLSAAS